MNDKLHPALAEHAMERENERLRGLLAQLSKAPQAGEVMTRERLAAICEVGHDRPAFVAALSQQAEPVEPAPAQDERKDWRGALLQIAVVMEALKSTDSAARLANMDAGKVLDEAYAQLKRIRATRPAQTEPTPWQEATGRAAFKNFHRRLCERFSYTHDEEFWWRDLISLEEHIAKQTEQQPTLWARQCDLDEPDPAIFVAREQVEESGYVVPFYAAPIAQTEKQPVAWLVIGEPFDGAEGLEAGDWDIEPVANLIDQLTVENSPSRIGLYAAPIAQTEQQPTHLSEEAASTLRGMVEYCLNQRVCMGMDEGFASFEPEVEHDFVKELRAFAESTDPIAQPEQPEQSGLDTLAVPKEVIVSAYQLADMVVRGDAPLHCRRTAVALRAALLFPPKGVASHD